MIDKTVLRETGYIAFFTLALTAVMNGVFLIVRRWDVTVLLGGLLGCFAAALNFFLMGLTVQKALGKDEKAAKRTVGVSMFLRMLMLFGVGVLGALLPCFNVFAVLIPFLFPRAAVMFRGGTKKNDK